MLIKLHGIIAKKFKEELDIPSEIDESFLFDILNTRFSGFKLFIQRQAQKGVFYEIVKLDKNYHIVPIICGNIGVLTGVLTSMIGNFLGSAIIGGIMGVITPAAEQQNAGAESVVVLQSTRFSALENVERQGQKVPVGYGRLRIGSKLVMQYKTPIDANQNREIENTNGYDLPEIQYLNPTIPNSTMQAY